MWNGGTHIKLIKLFDMVFNFYNKKYQGIKLIITKYQNN